MTTICRVTGKAMLSAAAAQAQIRHSSRGFQARRCRDCGRWHVNTPTFINREQRRRAAEFRRRRTEPLEEDTP